MEWVNSNHGHFSFCVLSHLQSYCIGAHDERATILEFKCYFFMDDFGYFSYKVNLRGLKHAKLDAFKLFLLL